MKPGIVDEMGPAKFLRIIAFVLVVDLVFGCGACVACSMAGAQSITALERDERAPFAGMLILDDELVAWRREIERLRFELVLLQQRADALRVSDAELAAVRERAGAERLALRERLWTERAATLTRERDEARAHRGPRWWQRGALWLPVGIVVGLVTGAVLVAR